MDTGFIITQDVVEQLIEKNFHSIIDLRINRHQSFVENIGKLQMKLFNATNESSSDIHKTINIKVYKIELSKMLKKYYKRTEALDFDKQFPSLINAMNKLVSKHKMEETRIQNKDRFNSTKEESFGIKAGKSIKKAGFTISKIGTFFNGNERQEHVWHHQVHARNIATFYWREHLSQRLITLINPLNRTFNNATVLVWKTDERIDDSIDKNELLQNKEELIALSKSNLEKAILELTSLKSSLRKKSKILVSKNWKEYEQSILKAGTFELSNKSFNTELLKKKHRVLNNSVLNLDNNWNNTKEILMDNWYLEIELRALQYISSIEVNRTTNSLKKKINEIILPQLDRYKDFISSQKEKVDQCTSESELQPVLNQCVIDVRTKLNAKMLNESTDIILNAELPELINRLELNIKSAISNISKTTTVHKETDYNLAIKNDEYSTSPIQELILFEGWPEYLKKSVEVKSKIISRITEIQNELINQGQITEFNIQTALELYEEAELDKTPQSVVTESMERSLETIGTLRNSIISLEETINTDLSEAITLFNDKVEGLSEDESLLAIKLKVATSRALEKSESLKIKIKETIQNFIPLLVAKIGTWSGKMKALFLKYKKAMGFEKQTELMALNLSDFLIESEQSYGRLPFIYQRLFRNEALNEKTFFVGRSKEIQNLKTALSRFKNKRFAASILLGEKGSGLTSTLNLFTEECGDQILTNRINNKETIHSVDELYELFSEEFGIPIKNLSDCTEFLKSRSRSMIIMENVHVLFLKKIHGFEIIEELTELISLTSDHVFWVLSCYSYCYEYLAKSIDFAEQFRYIISMEEFSDETMINIIKERHKVSGYTLSFQPSMVNLKSKKFIGLNEVEQQTFLENQYFTELNKLVKGNIRLGLSYWLRSTREVSGNRLVISPFRQFELTFLRNLSERNLYTLSNLILHDKLTLDDLADVMNIDNVVARRILQTLEEYGITMRNDDYFTINPLLYRQCLIVLKSKNIIH